MDSMKTLIVIALFGLSQCSWTALSAETTKHDPIKEALTQAPAAEIPARAADIVKSAKSRDRESVTAEVVRVALALNPGIAPAIVNAIAKAVPEMASIAAGTATQCQPKRAAEIVKAAAAAAPAKVDKIVSAVCGVVPGEYRYIALAAAQAVPGSVKEILRAVVAAIPELKPSINKVLLTYQGNPPSMVVVLDTARPAGKESPDLFSSPIVRGPTLAPPYIPPSQTSTNVTPSTSGTVPRGGRNYSAP